MSPNPGVTALGVVAFLVAWPASAEERPAEPRNAGLSSCVVSELSVPERLADQLPDRTDVSFDLAPTGRISDVQAGDPVSREIAPFIRDALERCGWTPAKDAEGNQARTRVDVELRVPGE